MIEATVTSGKGKAAEFLALKPYKKFLKKETGFEPFPGTLNLKVETGNIEKLIQRTEKTRMEGTKFQGKELGGIEIYPAKLKNIEIYILEADKSEYGKDIVEIIAENNLRKELNLEDGDKVKLTLRR